MMSIFDQPLLYSDSTRRATMVLLHVSLECPAINVADLIREGLTSDRRFPAMLEFLSASDRRGRVGKTWIAVPFPRLVVSSWAFGQCEFGC